MKVGDVVTPLWALHGVALDGSRSVIEEGALCLILSPPKTTVENTTIHVLAGNRRVAIPFAARTDGWLRAFNLLFSAEAQIPETPRKTAVGEDT